MHIPCRVTKSARCFHLSKGRPLRLYCQLHLCRNCIRRTHTSNIRKISLQTRSLEQIFRAACDTISTRRTSRSAFSQGGHFVDHSAKRAEDSFTIGLRKEVSRSELKVHNGEKSEVVTEDEPISVCDDNGRKRSVGFREEMGGLCAIAIPAFFSLGLDPLLSSVDTAIVGRLGAESLAATGISSMAFTYCQAPFHFMPIVTPEVTTALAQGDEERASRFSANSLWLSFGVGALITVCLIISGSTLLKFVGTSQDIHSLALDCLYARSVGAPALLWSQACHAIFRAHKNTLTPLAITLQTSILNFVLDMALVFGLGWGAAGAAIATSFSQWVGAGLLAVILVKQGVLSIGVMKRCPGPREATSILGRVLTVSVPHVISYSFLGRASMVVNQLGAVHIAAHEILRQVWNCAVIGFDAFNIATQTLIAEALGRGDHNCARRLSRRILITMTVFGSVIGCLLYAGRYQIATVFTSSAPVIEVTGSVLHLLAGMLPIDGVNFVLEGILIGGLQAGFMARTWALTSVCGLLLLEASGQLFTESVLSVWALLELMTLLSCGIFCARLLSRQSPLHEGAGGESGSRDSGSGDGSVRTKAKLSDAAPT